MADKYLKLDPNGNITEVEATTQSAGSANAGDIVALNDDGKIDETLLPDTISPEVLSVPAGEDLTAGDLVYLYDEGGTVKCKKALADDVTKSAVGFVKTSAASGANVNVYFEGTITGLSGLTVGQCYFLSDTTAGAITTTPTAVSNHFVQRVGSAISDSELQFERSQPIVRA